MLFRSAQAAVGHHPDDSPAPQTRLLASPSTFGKSFCVINEFNNWRKQPDLAEAVTAIYALAAVIGASEATTMMDTLFDFKAGFVDFCWFGFCRFGGGYLDFAGM